MLVVVFALFYVILFIFYYRIWSGWNQWFQDFNTSMIFWCYIERNIEAIGHL